MLDLQPKRFALLVLGFVGCLVVLSLATRGEDTPEDHVRSIINEMIEAAEERDLGGVLEYVDPAYLDAEGLDRDGLKVFLFYHFRSVGAFRVQKLGRIDVEIRKDQTALCRFRALLSEGLSLASLRNKGAWDFEVELAEEEGEWLVTAHRRRRR